MGEVSRVDGARFKLGGHVGRYLGAVGERWLRTVPLANPGILEMFRDRDRLPLRRMVPWAGEFAGKYLVGAVQNLRVTADPALRGLLEGFVADLVALQDEDGYLGPWPRGCHLTNHAPNADLEDGLAWDTWGHYHVIPGLLLWHEQTGDAEALRCAGRIGELACDLYLEPDGPSLAELDLRELSAEPAPPREWSGPMVAVKMATACGPLRLCDFASAGLGGSPYRSWLPALGLEPAPFARDNPLRTMPLPQWPARA